VLVWNDVRFYQIDMLSTAEIGDADRTLFEQIVASFRFAE
jgi:hypothetical protein